jgi:hypothetical protein
MFDLAGKAAGYLAVKEIQDAEPETTTFQSAAQPAARS